MNTSLLQADWNILKGKLKQAWALLTRNDEEYNKGKANEYLGRIQKKAGEKRAAIKKAKQECEELWLRIDQPHSHGCHCMSLRDAFTSASRVLIFGS